MTNAKRALLEKVLKRNWVPELKAKGFGGRPWKFLREREEFVDRVVMEFDRSGTGCRILLGVEPRHFPGAIQDEIPDFKKLRVTAYQFQQYVTAKKGNWFSFGDLPQDDMLILAEHIIDEFDEVSEPLFKEYDNLDRLKSYMPDDLADNEDLLSRFRRDPRKAAVFFCKMYRYLGQVEQARSFAEAGLKSKKGVFGEQYMRGILFSELLGRTSVRARVAFALSVAGDVVKRTLRDHPTAGIIEEATEIAWQWAGGERPLGEEFDEEIALVDSAVGRKNDTNQLAAWLCAISALYYAAFCAYRAQGDGPFPHPHDEMQEGESFCEILDHATRTWTFNPKRFEPLKEHLLQAYATSDPLELGPPLTAEAVSDCRAERRKQ